MVCFCARNRDDGRHFFECPMFYPDGKGKLQDTPQERERKLRQYARPCATPPEYATFLVNVEIQAIAGPDASEHAREVIELITDAFENNDIPATVRQLTLRSELN